MTKNDIQSMFDLITDRTEEDANKLFSVTEKINAGIATEEEIQWYLYATAPLRALDGDLYALDGLLECRTLTNKGAYGAVDLNRVGTAVQYITERLAENGYSVDTAPKTDWTMADAPTPAQMDRYLHDIRALRDRLPHLPSIPPVPESLDNPTYSEANDIEQILIDVYNILKNIMAAFRHCNAAVCGGGNYIIR